MSGDDGLREVIVAALRTRIGYREADLILALPEIAALRAKADGADRVRELHVADRRGVWCVACDQPMPCPTTLAIDGDQP